VLLLDCCSLAFVLLHLHMLIDLSYFIEVLLLHLYMLIDLYELTIGLLGLLC
jgi:hypothetical protein